MKFDLVVVGGGLQGALLALAVLDRDPDARLAVVEAAPRLGGEHTWSFHAGDLSPAMERVVEPLVAHRWPAWEVAFPGLVRRFERPYASLTSRRLHDVVSARLARAPAACLLLGAAALEVRRDGVRLAGGEELSARAVVDARGPLPGASAAAFQKFLGLEVELSRPLGRDVPLVMDARVAQEEGFRFVYVLPLAPDRALVEDTYYAETPDLDASALAGRIRGYVERAGGAVARVVRTEHGALPLPLVAGPRPRFGAGPLAAGYRGGWFHPATGYSLPVAARLAEAVAHAWPSPPPRAALERLAAEHAVQVRFATLLNRLLFHAMPPAERWRALERFHRLPTATVERFYALRTTALDRARILVGRPPRGVRLKDALRQLELSSRGDT